MNNQTQADYSQLKILVVDDHMIMRNMLSQSLKSLGIENITTAGGGQEALTQIHDHNAAGEDFDVVFLDWHMPDIEGFDVLKQCRENSSHNGTAFIMLTAEQEQKSVLKAIEQGATSYIIKPFTVDILDNNLRKILIWLDKNREAHPKTSIIQIDEEEKEAEKLRLSVKLRDELKPTVSHAMENIFSDFFQVDIVSDSTSWEENNKKLTCIGRLHQKDITIALRFYFDQNLLQPLLEKFYTPQHLQDEKVYEDAACEIVNILCGQVKAFLNKNGYSLEFDLPEMGPPPQTENAHSVMNVHFSLNEEKHFYVDMTANGT